MQTISSHTTATIDYFADSPGSRLFKLTTGVLVVVFWNGGTGYIQYALSSDGGKTWGTPVNIVAPSSPELGQAGEAAIDPVTNDLYVKVGTTSGTNRNADIIKLTYSSGTYTIGTQHTMYSRNNMSHRCLVVDTNSRVWLVVQEYNFSTNVWGDVVVTYSDDGGSSWSSYTTLKTSGGDGFTGYRPFVALRNGNPVVLFGSGPNAIGIREWNGSSWGSEQTITITGLYPDWHHAVAIGATLYIIFETSVDPQKVWLSTWNGSTATAKVELVSFDTARPRVATDGTDLFITFQDWCGDQRLRIFLLKYKIADSKVTAFLTLDTVQTNGYILNPEVIVNTTGQPVVLYQRRTSTTRSLVSLYVDPNYVFRISKSGYDVTTCAPYECSIASIYEGLHTIAKDKTTMNCNTYNEVTGRYEGTKTISIPNTGAYPLHFVQIEDKNGWMRKSDVELFLDPDDAGYSLYSRVENNQLVITMNSGSSLTNLDVYYQVFDKGMQVSAFTPASSYGFMFAKPGKSLPTTQLDDLIIHSEYMLPQMVAEVSGTINMANGVSTTTQTFNHGLSYTPLYEVFLKLNGYWYSANLLNSTLTGHALFTYVNGSQIKLRIERTSTPNADIPYKYYLFKDFQ